MKLALCKCILYEPASKCYICSRIFLQVVPDIQSMSDTHVISMGNDVMVPFTHDDETAYLGKVAIQSI